MTEILYRNREDAGRRLAALVEPLVGERDALVLGLPRGGLPVAFEVARRLQAQLDLFTVGKLGFPDQPELALGAITADGETFLNSELIALSGLTAEELGWIEHRKRLELERKEAYYRQGGGPARIEGRTVILVDDGAATGASMCAALKAVRNRGATRLIAAVPVASRDGLEAIRRECDTAACESVPDGFRSVGQWYSDFGQVSDEEVVRCLEAAKAWHWSPIPSRRRGAASPPAAPVSLSLDCGDVRLPADLTVPDEAGGLVIFAHGSGSGRHSPRNRRVAKELNLRGLATLLMDLLTADEDREDRESVAYRFDTGLLADRLVGATRSIAAHPAAHGLPIGYFGASTGAAAALKASVRMPGTVTAVVSRGGRPDLAADILPMVSVPCLFIVGGADTAVLEANRRAFDELRAEKRMEIVPGATHLFEEAGALEAVARLAGDWFQAHFAPVAAPGGWR